MRVVFVDANQTLAALAERLGGVCGISLLVNRDPDIAPETIPALVGDAALKKRLTSLISMRA